MTIFRKPLSAYVIFVLPLCILIVLVGFTRLALSMNGVPITETRWVSMTAVLFAGMVYIAVRTHTSGFGSYLQLLPSIVISNISMHIVSIVGIVVGIETGQDNVYTAPEYAFGGDGKTWGHVAAHLGIGMTVGSLVNWGIACLFLLAAKKLLRRQHA